jgi:hypothetical protein
MKIPGCVACQEHDIMKKTIVFTLAVALSATLQAAPPAKAAVVSKTPVPAAQAATTPAAQTGTGNAAAPNGSNNLVCPPGIKPQSGKCFARPTKSAQK